MACFFCTFASPESTLRCAVLVFFVTNLPRAPTQLLVVVLSSLAQNPHFGWPSRSHWLQICPRAYRIDLLVAFPFPPNPNLGGPSRSHSPQICPCAPRPHNCLFLLHFHFPRIHMLVGRFDRIRHKFAPRTNTIACFCYIFASPESIHFGGPSRSYSLHIVCFAFSATSLARMHILVGRCYRFRYKSRPHNRLCLLHFRSPRIHILVGRFDRNRHKFAARADAIACFCCIAASPASTFW